MYAVVNTQGTCTKGSRRSSVVSQLCHVKTAIVGTIKHLRRADTFYELRNKLFLSSNGMNRKGIWWDAENDRFCGTTEEINGSLHQMRGYT